MWLNIAFIITKEAISTIIGLNFSGQLPILKSMKNQIVIEATGSNFDKRAMKIEDIIEVDVKFASMIIGYKIYHSSWDNSISGTTIYVAY